MATTPKSVLHLLLLTAACAPASRTPGGADGDQVAGEVKASLAALTEAQNRHDGEAVVTFYAESPDFLYLGCTGFIMGGANFRRMVAPYYAPGSNVALEQRVVAVQVLSPTVAVVAQRGSSTEAAALFWTRILVKRDGRWVITYEHQSWPGCKPPPVPHPPIPAPGDSTVLPPGGPGH